MEKKFLNRTMDKPKLIEYRVKDDLGTGMISRVILNKGLEFIWRYFHCCKQFIWQ